ncbi:MAG: adenylate/guanylate cyclase domain-containing protein [Chloroflexota bacterium]
MSQPIIAELEVDFSAEPDDLWPLIADTNRFNRAIGLPEPRFARGASSDGELQIGELSVFGVTYARWREHPFEWQRPRGFVVVRDFLTGPLLHFRGGAELTSANGRTSVRFFAELTPRNLLFDPLIRYVVAPRQMARARLQFDQLSTYLQKRAPTPFPVLKHNPSDAERRKIGSLTTQLLDVGCPDSIVAALRGHIEDGGDEDVSGMRPLELAEMWDVDPRLTMETFLHAATVGLLEMRWELLCPSCRGISAAALALHDLQNEGLCTSCNLHFTASIDDAIEARFYPAAAIRPVSVGTYCVGGPMNTPHRQIQFVLGPGETRDLSLALTAGPWILRSPQSRGVAHVLVDPDAHSVQPRLSISAHLIEPDQAKLPTGDTTLLITNDRTVPATITLDDGRWSELAATPGRLLTYPAFRSLFSAEALGPGIELAVGRVGILFSDLAGSTALYERAGEAAAFRLVSDHFTVLEAAIERHGGALIKTIGDAVMAAFPDGRQALGAALAIQDDIRRFDTRGLADPSALVKIGVHAGACFVVTLNGRLDYFGTTVNIAARAQGEARGGEIVVTSRVRDEASDIAMPDLVAAETFEVILRGITVPVELVRITPRNRLSQL